MLEQRAAVANTAFRSAAPPRSSDVPLFQLGGMAKKYERKWHSPYYWDGWDEPGSNLSTISRGACPSGAPPSLNCPRCQENPRAGPCPDPAPMAEVMRLFPRVLQGRVEGLCVFQLRGHPLLRPRHLMPRLLQLLPRPRHTSVRVP